MGKPTGFLEYERKNAKAEAPLERIKHFNEFHTPLSHEEQQKQGARCMACGVPFCSGQPDIIPPSICPAWQKGTPHAIHLAPCFSCSSLDRGVWNSLKCLILSKGASAFAFLRS